MFGACAGCVLGYAAASPALHIWHEHSRFQALLATPTVKRATGSKWFARHSPGNDKWCDVDPKLPRDYKLECYDTNSGDRGTLHWIDLMPWERDWSKEKKPVPGQVVPIVQRLESFAPDPNPDGIFSIHYDVGGAVTSLDLNSGEKITEPASPLSLRMLIVPLFFPLAGFLLPWGFMKCLAWVAVGFTAPKAV